MLSFQDCLDLAGVTEGEIDAIVKHNGIPPIVALELGHELLQTKTGRRKLRDIITNDVLAAQARHRCGECEKFSRTLSRYLENYPSDAETRSGQEQHINGLAAIGDATDSEENESVRRSCKETLNALNDAKGRSDCHSCAKLSLKLIRAIAKSE